MFANDASPQLSSLRCLLLSAVKVSLLIVMVGTLSLVVTGCERTAGKLVSHEIREVGKFRFLVSRSNDPNYRKELSKTYWCSTAATRANRPTAHYMDAVEPQIYKGEGYVKFGGHGDTVGSGSEKKDFLDVHVVNERVAYYTTGLVATFDACMTRIYFNVSPGARFEDTMQNTPIRYPKYNIDFDVLFFTKLTPHENGGCFTINPARVDTLTPYFYCTSDNGNMWSLETSISRFAVTR
jgi:hypothetical protein